MKSAIFRCFVLSTIASSAFIQNACCQDSFHALIKRSVEERKKLTSFELEYSLRKSGVMTANSRADVRVDFVIEGNGTYLFDELSRVLVFSNRDKALDVRGTPQEVVDSMLKGLRGDASNVRAILLGADYVASAMDEVLVRRDRSTEMDPKDLPFDIRCFGLGLAGDISSYTPIEQIGFDICQGMKDEKIEIDDDGMAWCDFLDYQLKIDTKRGYWPVERVLWGTKKTKDKKDYVVVDKCTMELVEVDNEWVPKVVELSRPHDSQRYEFRWKSVNKLIDPLDIDINEVAEKAGKRFIQR